MIDQEDIGRELGLIVPPEDVHLFKSIPTGRMPSAGWGTRINLNRYSLARFFKISGYELKCRRHSAKNIKDPRGFIEKHLTDNTDLLVIFRYGTLYDSKTSHGHASLIESMDDSSVVLTDPDSGKRKKVTIDRLVRSVKAHNKDGVDLGGIWTIR